jgi:hypothetical protein
VLALAAFLGGCALPPYNEDLSLAQVTRSKLGQPVNTIGPVYTKLDNNARQNQFYFLPDRNDPANAGGFLVATASYGLRVWYLADTSGGLESSWSIDLDNASDTANNYLLQPIESSIAGNYFLSLTRYLQNDLRVLYSTGPSFVGQYTTELPLASALPLAVIVAGASIFPDNTTGSDPQYFLGSGGPGEYYEFACHTSSSGFVFNSNSPSTGLDEIPDDLTNAFYYHNPDLDKSYLSYWSYFARDYISYSWTWDTDNYSIPPSEFQQLAVILGRIDAVLTNGQLLSFDDRECTVYSPSGSRLLQFPMGSLKFCYEQWDPADLQFKLYFSLAYWLYGQEEKSDKLYVEVYAIPTAGLSKLD